VPVPAAAAAAAVEEDDDDGGGWASVTKRAPKQQQRAPHRGGPRSQPDGKPRATNDRRNDRASAGAGSGARLAGAPLRIIVKNLPFDCIQQDLQDLFQQECNVKVMAPNLIRNRDVRMGGGALWRLLLIRD
jgi:hypothetical protein